MFVWLSLLKGVVGGCVRFTCHGQFLSHPNVITHPKLPWGRRVQSSWISIPSLVFFGNQSLLPEWTKPNLKGYPCSHTETKIEPLPRTSIGFEKEKDQACQWIHSLCDFRFRDSAFLPKLLSDFHLIFVTCFWGLWFGAVVGLLCF